MKTFQRRPRSGFTLIEILVVISIIALLAAILFPAFARARESGRQANCASNLNQIYFAVQQYFQDERAYPDSLVDLLPEGAKFNANNSVATIPPSAGGYLKSTAVLTCQNDSTEASLPRSSYGALTKFITGAVPPTTDPARNVWNYWGYNAEGYAYRDSDQAKSTNSKYLVDPDQGFIVSDLTDTINPISASLSNRYADASTIITHCVFHRPQTANGLRNPLDLYADAEKSKYARDVVLRLDGSARSLDVSNWSNPDLDLWRTPAK
jgi:prepilin-type N-terminal cleavage/methylation domain-containing protein